MGERETHDFMSVDAFSQLPFMRREKPSTAPIRLFGFDFPPGPSAASETRNPRSSSPTPTDGGKSGEPPRKFECNFCFRNFPTSQALGGHQNAHKLERQRAKRASLEAAATADGHLQGLLGCHGHGNLTSHQLHYPSWSFLSGGGNDGSSMRYYSGFGSVVQPINGSPVSGGWRPLPATAHHRWHQFNGAAPPPAFALRRGDQERKPTATAILVRERYGDEFKDGVCLDLHL